MVGKGSYIELHLILERYKVPLVVFMVIVTKCNLTYVQMYHLYKG